MQEIVEKALGAEPGTFDFMNNNPARKIYHHVLTG
jgi:hypothetical protein